MNMQKQWRQALKKNLNTFELNIKEKVDEIAAT
jgi:hypothetical protein